MFSAAVYDCLSSLSLPRGVGLHQYADDLLVTAENETKCESATLLLLTHLAKAGFKVSKSKLQFCKPEVTYLGHILTKGIRKLTTDRVSTIVNHPKPKTKHQMMAFLGLVNYCRQWISDCSHYDKILRSLYDSKAAMSTALSWTTTAEEAYRLVKNALCSSPVLGLPNYTLPFHLYVHHAKGTACAVLAQPHGGGMRPVAFLSKTLDTTAQGLPSCLQAVAACALMVTDAEKIVLSHPMTLHSPHQVLQILTNLNTQHMSVQRRSGYETTLTSTSNLKIKAISSLSHVASALHSLISSVSPDQELPSPEHDCVEEITHTCALRSDLSEVPLTTGATVYVDGSCSKPQDGVYLSGYAVCQLPDNVLEAHALPFKSAQAAELYALTRACHLFADRPVTINTDSRYAFGVAHDFGSI